MANLRHDARISEPARPRDRPNRTAVLHVISRKRRGTPYFLIGRHKFNSIYVTTRTAEPLAHKT